VEWGEWSGGSGVGGVEWGEWSGGSGVGGGAVSPQSNLSQANYKRNLGKNLGK
jgi:hypothetical protein